MKNKETLEEAAEIFVKNRFTKQICNDESYPDIYASKAAIVESHILFAKWQQERSYSEEEVYIIVAKAIKDNGYKQLNFPSEDYHNPILEEWLEQFKKK